MPLRFGRVEVSVCKGFMHARRATLQRVWISCEAPWRRHGTARRAWASPIAIACLRLFTFLPDCPLFSVPRFRSCSAFFTLSDAFLLYFAILGFLEERVAPNIIGRKRVCVAYNFLACRGMRRKSRKWLFIFGY